ncbi:helix-turn-helix domain-containing protein [Streptomyces sp. NPDC002698]|uniref:helix-turn-helix domain-containing protein n=1 Tax=Streptomyces sp. NPDC002698 TaxID=3364660 RepID=UPI00369A7BDE
MADLPHVLEAAMRRRHLSAQALADRTGIRTPRIRAFIQDGTAGPIHPTEQELRELAHALDLPVSEVLPGAALAGVPGT